MKDENDKMDTCRVTREDKIRYEYINCSVGVASIVGLMKIAFELVWPCYEKK